MNRLIFIYILIQITCIEQLRAQDNVTDNEVVGFDCYYGGRQTKTVEKFTRHLKQNNYKTISNLLTSDNPGDRYLAVIALQRLSKTGKYVLSTKETTLISKIKNSKDHVPVCSGCVYFDTLSLQALFSNEQLLQSSKTWLDHNIK